MLTLKTPLQLNTIRPIAVHEDELGMRIIGNYQLMNIAVSPQDLLHMTTQPPEVYVGLESENHFISETNFEQKNEWKLTAVNQLLNRILLWQTPYFTYQDEVYISTVLAKLGIGNPAEFMEQVRQVGIRSESITELLKTYQENTKLFRERTERIMKNLPAPEREENGESPSHGKIRESTLWSEIFARIRTAECSQIICDHRMQFSQSAIKNEHEISQIQQMRQADELALTCLKQYIFDGDVVTLPEEMNYYEKKHLHDSEVTEKKVFGQLAAAMVTKLVREFGYEQYRSRETGVFRWTDFTRSFYGSTSEVIRRFEEYQSRQELRVEELSRGLTEWTKQIREEREIASLLPCFDEKDEEGMDAVFTLLENQNIQKQFMETMRLLEGFSAREFVQENEKIDRSYLETLFARQQSFRKFHESIRQEHAFPSLLMLQETAEDQAPGAVPAAGMINAAATEGTVPAEGMTEQTKEPAFTEIPVLAEMPAELLQTVLTEEDYFSYLSEVNRKNVEMNHLYREIEAQEKSPGSQTVVLSRESARKSALRALEHPQEVLAEIYENGQAIRRTDSEEIEHYLSLTDEQTRAFYQKILYGKLPGQPAMPDQQMSVTEPEQAVTEPVELEQVVTEPVEPQLVRELLDNQIRLLQSVETIRDETHREQIRELIRQTESWQRYLVQSLRVDGAKPAVQNTQGDTTQHLVQNINLDQTQSLVQNETENRTQNHEQNLMHLTEEEHEQNLVQSLVHNTEVSYTQAAFTQAALQNLIALQKQYLNEIHLQQQRSAIQAERKMDAVERLAKLQTVLSESQRAVERFYRDRLESAWLESTWLEHDRHERDRLEIDRIEQERSEHDRYEYDRLEHERLEHDRHEQDRLEHDRIEQERSGHDRYEYDRLEQEVLEHDERSRQTELRYAEYEKTETLRELPAKVAEVLRTEYRSPVEHGMQPYVQSERILNRSQTWSEEMVEGLQSTIRTQMKTVQNVTEQNTAETIAYRRRVEQQLEQIEQLQQFKQAQHLQTLSGGPAFGNETRTTVTEIVRQNMQTQLREISGEVYQKLERKLDGERRRRGY
jgi:hypothetical protein